MSLHLQLLKGARPFPKVHLDSALEKGGHIPKRVVCKGAWIFSKKAGIGFLVEALGKEGISLPVVFPDSTTGHYPSHYTKN